MDQLHDDMNNIRRELEREYPESNRDFVIDVLNLQYDIPDRRGRIMFGLLQGAVVFVLLIACVNIANLLLARTQARRREIALRASLGAGRMRIVRQLLTESILLAAMGGVLGLALGVVGLRVLAKSFAALVPSYWIPTVDTRVVMITLGLAALAGLLFGLSPAWMSFKVNLAEVLKEGGRGSMGASRRFVSRALVVAEIFFSVIFLGGGSVLVESFLALRNSDPGFDMENLLTVTLALPEGEAEQIALAERLIERAESVPGVLDATLVSSLPQNIYVNTGSFSVDEQPPGPHEPLPRAVLLITSPEYLDTLSFPVLRGRFFSPNDRKETGAVTVVSQSIAERYWPGQDAVGRRITVQEVSREIIGVVGDTQQSLVNQGESSQGAVYLPFAQQPMSAPFLLVRMKVEPEALAGAMRNELSTNPWAEHATRDNVPGWFHDFFYGERRDARGTESATARGLELLVQGELEQAIETLEPLMEDPESNSEARAYLGIARYLTGDTSRSTVRLLDDGVDSHRAGRLSRWYLASVLLTRRDIDGARVHLKALTSTGDWFGRAATALLEALDAASRSRTTA